MPSHRYLLGLGISLALTLGLVWLYVAIFPIAFMEGGYPIWKAKHDFIARCDLGQALISGDSRAEAAINPRNLDISTRNITFSAETPVEGYFFLREAMQCANAPQTVFISLSMPDFTKVSEFLWETDARFGFINYQQLEDISSTAREAGDSSVDNVKSRLGLEGSLRNFLYANRFPPLYFNALLSARIFGRYSTNEMAYAKVHEMLGHVSYVRVNHVIRGSIADDFHAVPVQDAFFRRTLMLLRQRGIKAVFIAMPITQRTLRQTIPAANRHFEDYLMALADRYPNFRVVSPLITVWPDEAFQDGVHLEKEYAGRFTRRFEACAHESQKAQGPVIPCDLSWDATPGR